MSIALTVIALLLIGVLVPLNAKWQERKNNEARAILAQASDAVVSYALQNRTTERDVLYYDGLPYTIPAGRPFFPCPDVNGDGLEDRDEIPFANLLPALQLQTAGRCIHNKGMLPWKSIGMHSPNDPWGGRLTYYADPAYTNALLGFDEDTRADKFDLGMAPSGGVLAQRPGGNEPRFICAGATGLCSMNNPGDTNAIAGVGGVAVSTFMRDYQAVDTVEGVAFVVLTHGKNGLGAVNIVNRCNQPPPSATAEENNAHYPTGHPFASCSLSGGPGFNYFSLLPVITRARGLSDQVKGYDDILRWLMPNELSGMLMRNGALPVPKLPFPPGQ